MGFSATPLEAIKRNNIEADIKRINEISKDFAVQAIVVGLPISLNGTLQRQARSVLSFTKTLMDHVDIPVYSQDERFSTAQADRLLRQAGHKSSREKGLLDSASAAVILMAYLDKLRLQRTDLAT